MITIIMGLPGAGKTAFMTALAVERMTGEKAAEELKQSKKTIKTLNSGGMDLTYPSKHLVFADYNISAKIAWQPRRISYDVDGFYLGLPNKQHITNFYPPCANFFLDEAQKYFNSRMSISFPDFASRFYETHRHNDYNIFIAAQRSTLIDLNIREIAGAVYEVVGMKHKLKKDEVVRTKWELIRFNSGLEAEAYVKSNKTEGGKKETFTFNGNIFDCYDSQNFRYLHYVDRYNSAFDISQSLPSNMTVDCYMELAAKHSFEIPKTFYKKRG